MRSVAALRAAFAMLGPPIAWALHLCACYFVVTMGCETGWPGSGLAVAIVTVIFGAITAGAGFVAWRDRARAVGNADVTATLQFVNRVGLVSAPVFLFAIVLAGIVPAFVARCS